MIEELSIKVTHFFYDYDPYEFKDNFDDYNEGLEEVQKVLSSKTETKNLIFNLKEINNDLFDDEDPTIKEFFNRSSKLIDELKDYEKSLQDDYEI